MTGKVLTAVIVGAGHRGILYASYALQHPEKFKIVGIVDPDKSRCDKVRSLHDVPAENVFSSVEELVARGQIADTVINATMDNLHVPTTLPLLEAGYDVLLEKPICTFRDDLLTLLQKTRETGRRVMICHVLRYAPFYAEIRKRLASGEIGEVLNIQAAEHVSYHHSSMGFVRGKWNRQDVCGSSMLMSKSCHDIDLIAWLKTGTPPTQVSSFGGLMYFKPEKAPKGAGTRCLVDCEIEESCPYSARKIHLDHPVRWHTYVWETVDPKDNPTREQMIESLSTDNPHGRCIWKCDNNVVDHQSVVIQFSDGSTATHNMVGGVSKPGRYLHIVGTAGEIRGCLEDGTFTIYKPDTRPGHETSEEKVELNVSAEMHGGGDLRLVEDFVNVINGAEHSISTTCIEDSVYGHLAGFAADEAMKNNSIVQIEKI
ncbi:MAG: Gfo/Idh/MocA family oxidoreductase [Actinomycetia bacterium]|nr:Gfo/Idh/MocA family oxidoreductase [Actinomycetes bacterium]